MTAVSMISVVRTGSVDHISNVALSWKTNCSTAPVALKSSTDLHGTMFVSGGGVVCVLSVERERAPQFRTRSTHNTTLMAIGKRPSPALGKK